MVVFALAPGCVPTGSSPSVQATPPASYSEMVSSVQARLNENGYNAGAVDGIVGPQTTAAVRRYQSDNGLSVDGVVDEALYARLVGPAAEPKTTYKLTFGRRGSSSASSRGSSGIQIANSCPAIRVHRVYKDLFRGLVPIWFAEVENVTNDRYNITADVEYRERSRNITGSYATTQFSSFTLMMRPRQRGDINILGNKGHVEVLSFDVFSCQRVG